MPHSLQIQAYNSKTHKIRRKLKTKYIGNKNKLKNNDQYLVYKPTLTLPKEFLNDNNDLKLTMLGAVGGRLFQTLMIRSLKKCFRTLILYALNIVCSSVHPSRNSRNEFIKM